MAEDALSRRGFLRVAASAGALAAGIGCSSDKPKSTGAAWTGRSSGA